MAREVKSKSTYPCGCVKFRYSDGRSAMRWCGKTNCPNDPRGRHRLPQRGTYKR